MDASIKEYVKEKTHELMNAATCSAEAKDAAQLWLDALGTERELEETKAYLKELEEDIVGIDDLISLAESDQGKSLFGKELAGNIAAHGKEIKAEGAEYCDCPACKAALAILKKKHDLLG